MKLIMTATQKYCRILSGCWKDGYPKEKNRTVSSTRLRLARLRLVGVETGRSGQAGRFGSQARMDSDKNSGIDILVNTINSYLSKIIFYNKNLLVQVCRKYVIFVK